MTPGGTHAGRRSWGGATLLPALFLVAALGILLRPRPVYLLWEEEEARAADLAGRGVDIGAVDLQESVAPALHEALARELRLDPAKVPPLVGPAVLFDADRDGDLDLFSAHPWAGGEQEPEELAEDPQHPTRFRFYMKVGPARFREVGATLGEGFAKPRAAVLAGAGDFDRDGMVDIVVQLRGGGYVILWNRLAPRSPGVGR